MNSFRFLERGIDAEIARQIAILEGGGRVVQETLHFDPETGEIHSLRSKEEAHDYRYFPEPDLVPLVPDRAWVEEMRGGAARAAGRPAPALGARPGASASRTPRCCPRRRSSAALLRGGRGARRPQGGGELDPGRAARPAARARRGALGEQASRPAAPRRAHRPDGRPDAVDPAGQGGPRPRSSRPAPSPRRGRREGARPDLRRGRAGRDRRAPARGQPGPGRSSCARARTSWWASSSARR